LTETKGRAEELRCRNRASRRGQPGHTVPADLRVGIRPGAQPVVEIRGEVDIQSAAHSGRNCSAWCASTGRSWPST
jgi:hypothetical protein